MGYDSDDSFPIDFEPNGIPFSSKPKGKLSPRSNPIQCERRWKHSFLSVYKQRTTSQFLVMTTASSLKGGRYLQDLCAGSSAYRIINKKQTYYYNY